jgi:SAM-dependent methyltransferase
VKDKPLWIRWLYAARDLRSGVLYAALARHCRGDVLDVGGWDFFLTARKRGLGFERWTTLEHDPERALSPAEIGDERVRLVHGDGCAMDFADASFDTVLCIQVVEHVLEPLRMVSEIGRVLGTAAGWERQRAQARALEEHSLRLGQMIEAVPAGFLLADADHSIRHANRRLLDLLRIPATAKLDDFAELAARVQSRIDPDEWLECLSRASPAATDLVLKQPRQVLSITAHRVARVRRPTTASGSFATSPTSES